MSPIFYINHSDIGKIDQLHYTTYCMNLDELKILNRAALIAELIRKTKDCAIIWNQIKVGVYFASPTPYKFYLSKINSDVWTLDVLKHASGYRTYSSANQTEVKELYETVDSIGAMTEVLDRTKSLISAVSQVRGCSQKVETVNSTGGLKAAGSSSYAKLTAANFLLLPQNLAFGLTPFPWSGSVTDIDENVTSHDSDATYIRQEVSGMLPTQWGYAVVKFNPSGIPTSGPKSFRIRVASRREIELGVNVVVELMIGPAVIFTHTFTPSSVYTIYNTGNVAIPDGTEISTLNVRLSMFTNVGDMVPRALRVTAVDLLINAFVQI